MNVRDLEVFLKTMIADVKLRRWSKMGDHPLVTEDTSAEFEYQELKAEGCGFIKTWTVVHPGDYLLEINDQYVCVLTPKQVKDIFGL